MLDPSALRRGKELDADQYDQGGTGRHICYSIVENAKMNDLKLYVCNKLLLSFHTGRMPMVISYCSLI